MKEQKLSFKISGKNDSQREVTFSVKGSCVSEDMLYVVIDKQNYEKISDINFTIMPKVEDLNLDDEHCSIIFKKGYKIIEHKADTEEEERHYIVFKRVLDN